MKTLRREESSLATDTALTYRRTESGSPGEAESPTTLLTMRTEPRRRHLDIPQRLRPSMHILHAIVDLELLPEGWDGHGGRGPTPQATRAALGIIDQHPVLLVDPLVGARPDGGLHLEWVDPACEVDVEPDGVITVLVRRDGDWDDYEFAGPGDAELHRLLGLLNR
jgi:hypothetical protein